MAKNEWEVVSQTPLQKAVQDEWSVVSQTPVEGAPKSDEGPGFLTRTADYLKQFAAPFVAAPFTVPRGIEQMVRGSARQGMEGDVDTVLPSTMRAFGGIDEEDLFGPETDQQKAQRKLNAQRAVAQVPEVPGLKPLAEFGRAVQKDIQDSVSEQAKQEMRDAEITGNIFKGELDFGKNPNIHGYALQVANVFGSITPVIATAMLTKSPTAAAGVGGGMAADEAAANATKYISKLSNAELLKTSPMYADMIMAGASEAEARDLITRKAAESGAILQGLVATFGGQATGKLVTGAFDDILRKAGGQGVAGRTAAGFTLGAGEESLQEVGEGLASDVAIQNVVKSKEIGEDSAANLIFGAIGGGAPGAVRGAFSAPVNPLSPEQQQVERIQRIGLEDERFDALNEINDRPLTPEERAEYADLLNKRKQRTAEDAQQQSAGVGSGGAGVGVPTPIGGSPAGDTSGVGAPIGEELAPDTALAGGVGVGAGTQPSALAPQQKRIDELTQEFISRGYIPTDAEEMAAEQVIKENQAGVLEEAPAPTTPEVVAPPVSTNRAKESPLYKYISGINPALDKFYEEFFNAPYETLPVNLQTARADLRSISDAMAFMQERLANWDHPAIKGETEHDRRMGKATATAEDRELIDAVGEMSALGARITNQAMAISKGYKGKKAGSQEKIDVAVKDAEKLFERVYGIMGAQGLLTEEEVKSYGEFQADKAGQEAPTVEETPTKPDELDTLLGQLDEFEVEETPAVREQVESGESLTPRPTEPTPYFGSEEINALGNRIKDLVEQIASDFMVGDNVRYGNIPGVVVGLDGDYIRFRPVNAKSPKAYTRVPKNKVTFESRPDTAPESAAMAKSDAENQKFGTEDGKLNADQGGLLQLLGAGMYAADVADTAIKELLQNAFDAVKGAVSSLKAPALYKVGNIEITIDRTTRTISIRDDARGMTADIVRDAFFTIAGTDKSDLAPEDRSGGLGIAKIGFMMGSKKITLDTVRDGVRVTVDATAREIADSNFKLVKKPAPKGEHGTVVTVIIPEQFVDPKTGATKNINFPYGAEDAGILRKPLIGPVNIKVNFNAYGDMETSTPAIGTAFPVSNYQQFKVNFSWGSADIYFGIARKQESYNTKHMVLSSGVYQFDTSFKLSQTEKIPYDIIVNVKPSVDARHPDYPFENSRERFKERIKEDISALGSYLAQIARGNEMADLKDSFENVVSLPRIEAGQEIADLGNKLKKAFDKRGAETKGLGELPAFPTEVTVRDQQVTDLLGKLLLDDKTKDREKEGSFAAEKEAPKREEFMTDMKQDPKLPIFHNNTNVDFIAIGKAYGDPAKFFAELGTLLVEMKELLAKSGMYGYDALKAENLFFGGISIDKKSGGLHIKVPYKAVLINPFYDWGARTLFGVRENFYMTMIHEIAHTGDMDHGVAHNGNMMRVEQYLADEGMADYFRDAILDVLVRHESVFTAMRETYGKSTTQNTAKSLEDYGKGSSSAQAGGSGDGSKDTLGSVSTGERPGSISDIRPASKDYPEGQVSRSAPKTGLTSGGLHPSVAQAILYNDLTGALKALARNTSGLYADLAARLAELNLPTNVSFDNAPNIVRRSIDATTAPQQARLFAYISRKYPKLFDKYFKNYDRVESLELINSGLQELFKPQYDIGPVAGEFADVIGAYKDSMIGLDAPGLYSPRFDEVSLNTKTRTGTSNRVLLHEVVHSATEYMLRGGVRLTERQMQAVASLYEMYEYAKTKLPTGEYGLTNIYEFVAEAMSNGKFQKLLKGIHYKNEKPSIFNRFVQSVMQLFGKDNLASSVMIEANEIFSAVRPAPAASAGLRFARKPTGPFSTPDSSRTAESVTTTIGDTIAQATQGRPEFERAAKDMASTLWETSGIAVRKAFLPVAQLRQLRDLTRTKFPQIGTAVEVIERMVSYRGKKLKLAANIAKDWIAQQVLYPEQARLMGQLMLEVTMRKIEVDPLGPNYDASKVNLDLKKGWDMLSPEFQSIYRRTREFYSNSVQEMIQEMKNRASHLPAAERQVILDKIDSMFGPDKLVTPYFPLRRFGTYWFQVGTGNNKEFYMFTDPITRGLSFRRRRNELSRGNATQKELAATMEMGNGISEVFNRNIGTTKVLEDVQQLVDGLSKTIESPPKSGSFRDKNTDELKAEIRDSLNQLIYLLLPQQSMRKMFINRKHVQGASSDMLRVFAYSAVHSAYQQARFKYAQDFTNNISTAQDFVDRFPDPQKRMVYDDYIREVEKRTGNILGIEDKNWWAAPIGAITNTTFFFMLSAPATALLNVVGATVTTMPYIGSRYGYAKTNALLTKNLGRYAASTPTRTIAPLVQGAKKLDRQRLMQVSFPTIAESGMLSMTLEKPAGIADADWDTSLQRAADLLIDDGDMEISTTNDIFSLGETPSELQSDKVNVVKKVMAGAFHHLESFNRQNAMLTTFELAYQKFLTDDVTDERGIVQRVNPADPQSAARKYTPQEAFDKAIGEARDIAGLTLGDFTRQLKGRIFTSPGVNLLTQFKQYAITNTYLIFRNHYLAFAAPFNKSEMRHLRQMLEIQHENAPNKDALIEQQIAEADAYRRDINKEGFRRLMGIMGMAFLWGGLEAQPFFWLLLPLMAKMFRPEDDDDEFTDNTNWFRNYMLENLGGSLTAAFVDMGKDPKEAAKLARKITMSIERGPIATAMGASLSERVSLDLKNMWYREGRYEPRTRDTVIEEAIANIGPSAALTLNWADAWDLMKQGQIQRAYEAAVPSLFSAPAKAERLGTEGATTRSGELIGGLTEDKFSGFELAMQAIGFQPEKLALAQKSAIEAVKMQQKIMDKKTALMNRLWMDRGTPAYDEALKRRADFNLMYPELEISDKDLQDSFETRTKLKAQAEALGAKINPKLITRLAPMLRYGQED
jgi:hypothetical protein